MTGLLHRWLHRPERRRPTRKWTADPIGFGDVDELHRVWEAAEVAAEADERGEGVA